MNDKISLVELVVVWLVSIVVFGSVGYVSISKAVELARLLGIA